MYIFVIDGIFCSTIVEQPMLSSASAKKKEKEKGR